MRTFFLFILIIFLTKLHSQNGYQKNIKLEYSNAIISSQIINDTISICNLSNNLINGFYIDNFLLDTFAKKVNEFKIINDSVLYVGYPGESSKVISYDEFDNTYNYSFSSGGILFIKYSYESNEIQFIKKYKYRNGKSDQIRPFGIMPIEDGYIIYGDTQWKNEQVAVYGFTLKIDKEGNEVAWNIFKDGGNSIGFKNGLLISDSIALILAHRLIKIPFTSSSNIESSIYSYNIYKNTIENKIILKDLNTIFLYNLFPLNLKEYIGIGYHKVNTNNSIYHPALIIYDSMFLEQKVTYFGIKDKDVNKILPEWPYQSTIDLEGNIYATTTSLIYPTPEKVDTESIEVITLTKFNPEGDIIWETIDSFDKVELQIKDRWIRPTISSVNVASSGSVFVTGYYSDTEEVFIIDTFIDYYYYVYYDSLLMRDTFGIADSIKIDTITQLNRGVGFLFKYDKDGCRISGCRIVDTNDEVIEAHELKVFPNPAAGTLNINLPNKNKPFKLQIHSVLGERVYYNEQFKNSEVDISSLQAGSYILCIIDDDKIFNTKFIKL